MTFDEVFKIWLDNEVPKADGRDLSSFVLTKGFTSIAQWRLTTALQFGMDKMKWHREVIDNPGEVLPNVIIGPYKGWSIQQGVEFFDNQLNTTFAEALEIKEFFDFCNNHDRIVPLAKHFPLPTSIILFRRPDGKFIHAEGGHRMCAVAYANKIGQPIVFENKPPVTAAVADITNDDFVHLLTFAKLGTDKNTR